MAEQAQRRRRRLSPDGRASIVASNMRRRGQPRSPETCAKISEALNRPETRALLSANSTGRKHSPETRALLSAIRTGHTVSQETRDKISDAKKGRKLSDEHRALLSAIRTGHTVSQETRDKISATHRRRRTIPAEQLGQVDAILARPGSGRLGAATSRPRASHSIRLGEPQQPTYIDGQEVKALTPSRHAIVSAVLAAKSRGLTEGEIRDKSGHGGGATTLRRLRDSHRKWAEIIIFPGRPHGRIRINAELRS